MRCLSPIALPVLAFGMALASLAAPTPLAPKAAAQGLFGGTAGANCSALIDGGGTVWQGFIRGMEESRFNFSDSVSSFTDRRCFTTEADCEAWLYDAQSAAYIVNRTWCRPVQG